jgi:hypothetical protein
MRVSDADRDAAITDLGEHYQVGRLTQEEFDERSAIALRARTGNDLTGLFTDLPISSPDTAAQVETARPAPKQLPPPWPPEPMPGRPSGWRGPRAPVGLIAAFVVIAIADFGGSLGHGHHAGLLLIPIIVLVGLIVRRTARPWR